MKKQKSKIFKNIGIALIVFLVLFFIYFTFSNTNSYKKEINQLNKVKITLEHRIDSIQFEIVQDSIEYTREIELLIKKIKADSILFEQAKKDYYEKEHNYVYNISIDSNIELFTRLLSSKNSNK